MATINILGTGTPGTAITKNATDVAQTGLSSATGAFTVNNLLQAADSSGSVKSLSSNNSAVLVTNSSGTPSYSSSLSDGQIIIGATSGTPSAANLVAGSNITITNAANSITIAATGGGGGGTINSGTANQLAYYAANGTTLSGTNSIGVDCTFNTVSIGLGNNNQPFNTRVGFETLFNNTTGNSNLAFGYQALRAITTGSNNVAIGSSAAFNIGTSSTQNVAIGSGALNGNAIVSNNIAIGFQAIGVGPNTGSDNVAIGNTASRANTSGNKNIAIGTKALFANTASTDNVAVGFNCFQAYNGASGNQNVAIGSNALLNAAGSISNTVAIGFSVLNSMGAASANHVISANGLTSVTTGANNTALGFNIGNSTVVGSVALTTGGTNTLIGYQASVNNAATAGAIAIGANSIARIATGATSSDNGPGISFGSSVNPVGFRGDGTIYTGGAGQGYWRPNINGTAYLSPLFVDGTLTARASMVTDTNGSPILSGSMGNGALIIGSSTGSPAVGTLTQGTYITVTNAANSITIDTVGPVMTTVNVTGTSQAAAVNTRYLTQNAAATTITVPATCALGDRITICGAGGASWVVQMNTGQTLFFSNSQTTAGGTMTANHEKDSVTITCIVANTDWVVESFSSGAKFTSFT